ncbi:MAG: DUF2190 domain-containing protein [Actinobacteria bacterium]|nr:DUF2190 domain-containing protein [Actinomycetota bacterium]
MTNEMYGIYEPGADITGHASAAVTGRRFLKVSGNRTDGNVAVNHATAGGRAFGVSKYSADSGKKVGVARGNSRVVQVDVVGTVAAFGEVEVGANGTAIPKNAGVAVGFVVTGVADAVGEVSLY